MAILDEWLPRERRRGDVPLLGGYLNARARILAFLGRLREAEEVAREGLSYDTVFVHSWGQPSMLAALITPLVWMGRFEEAQQVLDERAPAGPIGPVGTFHIARMELRCAQGRYEEAVADAEALIKRLAARRHGGIRLLDVAAATFLAAGDHERAAQVARDGLEVVLGAPQRLVNQRLLSSSSKPQHTEVRRDSKRSRFWMEVSRHQLAPNHRAPPATSSLKRRRPSSPPSRNRPRVYRIGSRCALRAVASA